MAWNPVSNGRLSKLQKLSIAYGYLSLAVLLFCVLLPSHLFYKHVVSGWYAVDCENQHPSHLESYPRVVHRIYDSLPDKYIDNWQSCVDLNPGYKFILWNTSSIEKLIEKQYAWFWPTYQSYEFNINRFDAARYFLIYHHGGIYLDMDVECMVSFDTIYEIELQNNESILLPQGRPFGNGGHWLIGKRKHPFMKSTIYHLQETTGREFVSQYFDVIMQTGPFFLYENYMRYPCKEQVRIVPFDAHQFSYLLHHSTGQWMTHKLHVSHILIEILLIVWLILLPFYICYYITYTRKKWWQQ